MLLFLFGTRPICIFWNWVISLLDILPSSFMFLITTGSVLPFKLSFQNDVGWLLRYLLIHLFQYFLDVLSLTEWDLIFNVLLRVLEQQVRLLVYLLFLLKIYDLFLSFLFLIEGVFSQGLESICAQSTLHDWLVVLDRNHFVQLWDTFSGLIIRQLDILLQLSLDLLLLLIEPHDLYVQVIEHVLYFVHFLWMLHVLMHRLVLFLLL